MAGSRCQDLPASAPFWSLFFYSNSPGCLPLIPLYPGHSQPLPPSQYLKLLLLSVWGGNLVALAGRKLEGSGSVGRSCHCPLPPWGSQATKIEGTWFLWDPQYPGVEQDGDCSWFRLVVICLLSELARGRDWPPHLGAEHIWAQKVWGIGFSLATSQSCGAIVPWARQVYLPVSCQPCSWTAGSWDIGCTWKVTKRYPGVLMKDCTRCANIPRLNGAWHWINK